MAKKIKSRRAVKPTAGLKPAATIKTAAHRPTPRASKPRVIDPGWSWDDRLPMAQAKQIGPFIYTSGQGALEPDGRVAGVGDAKAQALKAWDNIKTVLKLAGVGLESVIKITTYLTSAEDFPKAREARAEVFGKNPPASTTVVVKELAFSQMLIEIEALAIKL